MSTPIVQIDAFTAAPFAGNPAGVCILARERDVAWMQHVAREMNLAETAFVIPQSRGFGLRWFTPTVEMELCGHATLAAAHALWEGGHLPRTEQARFETKSGLLTADLKGEWIEMNFPATPAAEVDPPAKLLESLRAPARHVAKSRFDYLVELESEEAVRALDPDIRGFAHLPARGVIVTSRSATPDFDFVSRFFAPAAGVDEDPVTGSAHSCLAPFWGARLGKSKMTARQLSSRGGVLKVELASDRVLISGQAVTVMRAEILA
ncbi:MAG: PhzF family phenazine biosynthesis protein [Acidobacteria bacterium]|nr:PhzF family phenazine biosynthesis protein [Acidobacteriota bacterium]